MIAMVTQRLKVTSRRIGVSSGMLVGRMAGLVPAEILLAQVMF